MARHDDPAIPSEITQISVLEFKAMLLRGVTFEFVDVRTDGERELARVEGSRLLDREYYDHLIALDSQTPMVFMCHHGMRSQAAAEHFLAKGFRYLYNVTGGIDEWSLLVDPAVPRY
jgi:monothiol glutaredoxin